MAHTQLTHCDHKTTLQQYPLSLLLIDVERPDNVGSMFRIADALGIEKIYLSGKTVTPPNAKIRKTSRSTERFVPFTYQEDAHALIQSLKESDYQIISLEITNHSQALQELVLPKTAKVCLVLGSESHGINDSVLAQSDTVIHIPMLGRNSSMNVANACSIASFVISQQLQPHA